MQAATNHRRQIALMKEQQRDTLANGGNRVPRSKGGVGMPLSSASTGRQSLQFAPPAAPAHASASYPPGASSKIGHSGKREVKMAQDLNAKPRYHARARVQVRAEDETAARHRKESQLQAEVQLAQFRANSKYDPIGGSLE